MSSITPGIQFPTRITVTSNFVVTASLVSDPMVIYTADTYTRSASITGFLPPLSSVQVGGVVRMEHQGPYVSFLSTSTAADEIGYRFPTMAISTVSRADTYAIPWLTSGSMTAASTQLDSPVLNAFAGSDQGTWIAVSGAGTAGAILSTTIATIVSSSRVLLASTAATTVTSAQVFLNAWSLMGVSGDTRARVYLTTADNRLVGGVVSTYLFASGLTGSASVTALNNQIWPTTHYNWSENFSLRVWYLNGSVLSSGATGSSGTLTAVNKYINLTAADNYVDLQATVDPDSSTRRWRILNGTLDTVPQGRNVQWGLTQNLTGYAQDLRTISASDFYYDGNNRRAQLRTFGIYENGDPPELMGGRIGGIYPYGTPEEINDPTNSTTGLSTIFIIWSRCGPGSSLALKDNRNNFLIFRGVGDQTSSNSAGQLEFGGTYRNTVSDRRTSLYLTDLTNFFIGNANGDFASDPPRFGVQNAWTSVSTASIPEDQTTASFWAQSSTQTKPVVRVVMRTTSTASTTRLMEWAYSSGATWGTTPTNVVAYITAGGAGAIDTSWTSPASDIAEWKVPWWDGNPKSENRKARTVVFVDADNPDRAILRGTRGKHKATKLRLWNSFEPPISLDYICGVTTSKPAFVMGAAPMHYRDKYLLDPYGFALSEEAPYVEWTEVLCERAGARAGHGPVYVRHPQLKGDFVDVLAAQGVVVPRPSDGNLEEIIAEHEAANRVRTFTFITPPVYSKQPRKRLNPKFDPSREYLPRPERAEWFDAGITEKGMVPLHDDEPILDSWWVLGEAGPGLIWVSI